MPYQAATAGFRGLRLSRALGTSKKAQMLWFEPLPVGIEQGGDEQNGQDEEHQVWQGVDVAHEETIFNFMDNRELDPPRGLLVSNGVLCHPGKLRSVYIFEIDPNRYHKECASRTMFLEALQ
jgi:hypothetical protein